VLHTFRFEFRITPGSARLLLAACLLALSAGDLASESLTLSTYYPAPLGVYASIITTGSGGVNTLLARDSGRVGIGPNAKTPLTQLQVTGDGTGFAQIGGGTGCGGNYTGISLNSAGMVGCGNYNILSSPSDPDLYINRPSGRGLHLREANGDQLYIAPGGAIDFTAGSFGHAGSSTLTLWGSTIYDTGSSLHLNGGAPGGWVYFDGPFQTGSYYVDYTAGGCYWAVENQTCVGGYYASWTAGTRVEHYSMQNRPYVDPAVKFYILDNTGAFQQWTMAQIGVNQAATQFYCCPE
jgi:hypothetical protein